jgi:hypothetical protein
VLKRFAQTLAISREDLRELGTAIGARYLMFVVFDEYSFGWGEHAVPVYTAAGRASQAADAMAKSPGGGLVQLGVSVLIKSAAPNAREAEIKGKASARLAGTLSIFDAADGHALWVGAAMVDEQVEESKNVDIASRETITPKAPEPARLTPRFFDALIDRLPGG